MNIFLVFVVKRLDCGERAPVFPGANATESDGTARDGVSPEEIALPKSYTEFGTYGFQRSRSPNKGKKWKKRWFMLKSYGLRTVFGSGSKDRLSISPPGPRELTNLGTRS